MYYTFFLVIEFPALIFLRTVKQIFLIQDLRIGIVQVHRLDLRETTIAGSTNYFPRNSTYFSWPMKSFVIVKSDTSTYIKTKCNAHAV
jgi:hypothetical protein